MIKVTDVNCQDKLQCRCPSVIGCGAKYLRANQRVVGSIPIYPCQVHLGKTLNPCFSSRQTGSSGMPGVYGESNFQASLSFDDIICDSR